MAYVKVLLASFLAAGFCLASASAEDAAGGASDRTPTKEQQGDTNDKGMKPYGSGDAKPAAEVTTPPAAAPSPQTASRAPAPAAPAGGRLIYLDGNPVYVDQNMNIIGQAGSGPNGAGGAAKDPTAEQKRKEREEAAAKIERENRIQGAIRRLTTSGWREAQDDLIGYGKDAVPFLIDAMGNTDTEGNAAPGSYQVGGHNKPVESHAARQRTRGDVCAELLTDMVTNHSNFRGELPTLSQEDWKAWWAANGDKISFGK